jgi:hypothetical protein
MTLVIGTRELGNIIALTEQLGSIVVVSLE